MSTQVAFISNDEVQNNELWKTILEQRQLIQDLKKELVKVTSDRDSLLRSIDDNALGPTVPPRSPFRATSDQRSDQDDQPPKSPALAIVDKDAQVFAQYQEAQLRRTQSKNQDTATPPAPMTAVASTFPDSVHMLPVTDKTLRRASSQPHLPRDADAIEEDEDEGDGDSDIVPWLSAEPDRRQGTVKRQSMKGVSIEVINSNVVTNDKGKDIVSFVISVRNADGTEMWRIEKRYSDFLTLDGKLKLQTRKASKLPDKAMFSTNAPSKVDKRKAAIEQYLQQALVLSLSDTSDLYHFLNTNVVREPPTVSQLPGHKQGYLAKRGKNFGGWKTRYFVLSGPILRYFVTKEGALLGKIDVRGAQISRLNSLPAQSPTNENWSQFRYAFLVLEPKLSAPNGVHQHTLYAESDSERDEWVDALRHHVHLKSPSKQRDHKPSRDEYRTVGHHKQTTFKPHSSAGLITYNPQRSTSDTSIHPSDSALSDSSTLDHGRAPLSPVDRPTLRPRASLDQALLASPKEPLTPTSPMSPMTPMTPVSPMSPLTRRDTSPSIRIPSVEEDHHADASNNGKKKKTNRRTFWGKKIFTPHSPFSTRHPGDSKATSPTPKKNAVFGVPLEEALAVARATDNGELPAIIYRCISYLEAKNATREEGIYRLSGSAVKIRTLKELFDTHGDIDLLHSEEYHDIHAVAGLLKLWLRELPENVLTEDMLKDFLSVIDLIDRQERINELGRLVSLLPLPNYTLLRTLSAHLIRVAQNADYNKMPVRNVGIVFSPTLGIPAGIFCLFLSDFDYIFWTKEASISGTQHSQETDGTMPSTPKIQTPESIQDPVEENITIPSAPPPPLGPVPKPPANAGRMRQTLMIDTIGRSNRNSVHYMDSVPISIVDMEILKNDRVAIVVDDDDELSELGIAHDVDDHPVDGSDVKESLPPSDHDAQVKTLTV